MTPGSPDDVRSRAELAAFVRALRQDLGRPEQPWENATLEDFLSALASWIEDSGGWYRRFGEALPADGDWTFFARALDAATLYE
ncbi:hypothetical protein [Streptomyces sp. CB03911]|uniref:DUF7660 family protein n=1 Tax=Streptomyces sp. CB03911 TaxID=1804758 RepID=UPI00093B854F|nr:hypothetical protein [Streptomyces sp. CB03911]OKI26781.1 hypothetical protein A6A07_28605 [Streptomyces sp. CB03911]